MIALSGVRNSWLILARNCDLAVGRLRRLLRVVELHLRRLEVCDLAEQSLFGGLYPGDVGADPDDAAVARASFDNPDPVAVSEALLSWLVAGSMPNSSILRIQASPPSSPTSWMPRSTLARSTVSKVMPGTHRSAISGKTRR